MICSIHQPQSFPWLGYFAKIIASDVFIYLDNVQYKKNEYQNRNRIKYKGQANWLTIPVRHSFGQLINEIEINNKENWRRKILNTLKTYYAAAPHFSDYFPEIERFINHPHHYLAEFNMEFINWVLRKLNIPTKTLIASELFSAEQLQQYEASEKLVRLIKKTDANTYLSGVGGKDYLKESVFLDQNIKILYQNYVHPEYQQLGENFVSHLSILDLLFNEGGRSREIIMRGTQ